MRQFRKLPGYAGTAGYAQGSHAGARLDQEGIGMAVIAAFEFDDLVSARIAPGQTDGAHDGFRSGTHHPDHLDGGEGIDDHLRHLRFQLRRGAVGCPPSGGRLDRFDDQGMAMAQDGRPPGKNVIDVFPSLHCRISLSPWRC